MGDFCRLHRDFIATGLSHGGIIVVPQQRYSVGEQLRGLLSLIECLSAEDMIDQLIFLSNHL
jgi:Tfp pilus assembly protein PilZ